VLCVPAFAQRKVISSTASPTTTSASSPAKPQTQQARPRQTARRPARRTRRAPAMVDPTKGDNSSRDDAIVRAAAVEALGNRAGSLVALDPSNGQILAIVNQKMAFESYQPCSTFKPAVALAALEEGLIENDKHRLQLGRRWYLNLIQSLTLSNNLYFEKLGGLLGLTKMHDYAERFGFGELASWGLPDESRGALPTKAPPAARGGVGRIASFGEGIKLTPLQLASFMSAVANGGTLFYLQYASEEGRFEPLVKRRLEIGPWLKPVRQGLEEAVLTGTARTAKQPDFTILGKTGTCRQDGTRLGWFGGYSQTEGGLAVAVLLRGGRSSGPLAAGVAGRFYRTLADRDYVAQSSREPIRGAPPASVHLSPIP
ncbi:MAG: penicillin-binding transpeptidase domain-containing protein, partial [Terriglobia bacterium]